MAFKFVLPACRRTSGGSAVTRLPGFAPTVANYGAFETPFRSGNPGPPKEIMNFHPGFIKLNQHDKTPEIIKSVNRLISSGEAVCAWQGPPTDFADPGDLIFSSATSRDLPTAQIVELPKSEIFHLALFKPGRVALLWDKSFLWGYLAVKSLRDLGFSFDLVTAKAVRHGALDGFQLLIVPGGWASLKSANLGAVGRYKLRRYVASGGGYLGLCGGAGLALQVDEGLSLLPVKRKPMAERLPNFSGSIRVRRTSTHSLWWGLQGEVPFQVWWPSQFELVDPNKIKVLGRYGLPEDDFCVSDINVCEAEAAELDWESLERDYQINLDPSRLLGEPAVLEGQFGKGRVILSYPHLETPGDAAGNMALFNIWYDLLDTALSKSSSDPERRGPAKVVQIDEENLERTRRITRESEELVALGESYNLWSWRNPWLLKWNRGVPGAEFGTVSVLLQGLATELERTGGMASIFNSPALQDIDEQFEKLEELWSLFRDKGRALVEEEGSGLRSSNREEKGAKLSPQGRVLRTEIFDCVQCYGSKSYGGLYRQILDQIDTLLLGSLLADLRQ